MANEYEKRFDDAVKSLVAKLQPEYERMKKLKESSTLSTTRELQILDARRKGFHADFSEQEIASQEIKNYNNKVEGIAMALQSLSNSYGVSTFITRRFRVEYLV